MVCLTCMGKLWSTFIVLFVALIFVHTAQAKILPQAAKLAVKQKITFSGGTTINVTPKLRADRRALIVNFSNLQNAKSVSYMLTYKTALQEEAAMGALNLTGSSTDKAELLFGTCSKNFCRYHTNIKNAKLEVSYTSKTGKKYLKKFKIKV